MNFQNDVVGGFLGADATFGEPSGNGQVMVRFSIATRDKVQGKDHTNWHQVCYISNSQREADFLQASLRQGSPVLVTGRYRFLEVQHHEFPVKTTKVLLLATSLEVLPSGRRSQEIQRSMPQAATTGYEHHEQDDGDSFGHPPQDAFDQQYPQKSQRSTRPAQMQRSYSRSEPEPIQGRQYYDRPAPNRPAITAAPARSFNGRNGMAEQVPEHARPMRKVPVLNF